MRGPCTFTGRFVHVSFYDSLGTFGRRDVVYDDAKNRWKITFTRLCRQTTNKPSRFPLSHCVYLHFLVFFPRRFFPSYNVTSAFVLMPSYGTSEPLIKTDDIDKKKKKMRTHKYTYCTVPRPIARARWQLLRVARSYGKVEECESFSGADSN